ncbi:MAG: MotB family protein [Hyphomicrobiales bacterium]|nr:MotB family protein [Hyphomicrobiales bacterium]
MSARPEIVVIKRRSALDDAHHGGAWKIAFADFMTAMMAFFLVLWIISATDKNTKTLIARYFNPVKLEEPAKAQKGIRGSPERDTDAPGKEVGAPNAEKPRSDQGQAASGVVHESTENPDEEAKKKHPAKPEPKQPTDPARPNPTMSEEELFSDPRASLDKITGNTPPGPRADSSAALKGYGQGGPSADEAVRDPFRPLGSDKATNAAESGAPTPVAAGDPPGVNAQASSPASAPDQPGALAKPSASPGVAPPSPQTAPPEPSEAAAQGKAEASPPASAKPPPDAKAEEVGESRVEAAAALLAEVKKRLGPEAQSLAGPELDIQATEEGILISLTDRDDFSMFAVGSAEPQPRVIRMMDAVAMSLETLSGPIVVRGHTDARPYRTRTYDNWRLSSARAQMAYYMLNRAGVAEKRFERIEGFADHRLRDPAHPFAAQNRRIEILLRGAKP